MDWFSLLLPFGYLTVLLLSLSTFSYLYRRRKVQQAANLEPWFDPHTARQIYLTLLEQASAPKSEKAPKIPDSVLRAALLRRATEDIRRLMAIRAEKPALTTLMQRGALGDSVLQRFQVAEREMEEELKDVVAEANALGPAGSCGAPGQTWGQIIFQNAGECVQSELLRGKLKELEEEREDERARWVAERGSVREGFLKELEGASSKSEGATAAAVAPVVKTEGTSAPGVVEASVLGAETEATEQDGDAKKQGSSDEDAVLVDSPEAETPASAAEESMPSTPVTPGAGGGGGKKKKKNKK